MSNPELATMPRSLEVALMLTDQLLNDSEQIALFEYSDPSEYQYNELMRHFTEKLKRDNEDKLVIHSSKIDEFRYKAAMYGARFHPSQFEDISYKPTNESGTYVGVMFNLIGYTRQLPEVVATHNRMRDEISEELFTDHVPTTTYDLATGNYVTTEEDLCAIFKFDYENLQACRDLDFDLLYERKD